MSMDFVVSAFKVSLCIVLQFNLDVVQGDVPSVGTCYSFLLQYQECRSVCVRSMNADASIGRSSTYVKAAAGLGW